MTPVGEKLPVAQNPPLESIPLIIAPANPIGETGKKEEKV
jgi:hypothetical protein